MSVQSQEDFFSKEGGDSWYDRCMQSTNTGEISIFYLFNSIANLPFTPQNVLEIGCSSGKKLKAINEKFKCQCSGIDPSIKAINEGKKNANESVKLFQGTADNLPFADNSFDVVFFGFCLYLCSRDMLFKIAMEADRVLRNGGAIIILDFDSRIPIRNSFCHTDKEIWSYKMEYEKMFTWHPQFIVSAKYSYNHTGLKFSLDPNERLAFTTIMKVAEHESMPANPWSE